MTDDKTPPRSDREWEQQWVAALLDQVYHDRSRHQEQQIQALMQRVRAQTPQPLPANGRRWPWYVMASAAVLLLLLWPLIPSDQSRALARVQRTLATAAQPVPRHYQLRIDYRFGPRRTRTIEGDLYVQGSDHLAVRIPALLDPERDAWAGHNSEQAWVVPAFGPVMVGDQLSLGKWLRARNEVATPYLHVSSMLNRMMVSYSLQELADQSVPASDQDESFDRSSVRCHRIRALRRSSTREKLPARIELWIDPDSGVVKRLDAHWNLEDRQVGRERITLDWRSESDLPIDWFQHQGHHGRHRSVVEMDSESETGPGKWLENNG